MPAQIPPYYTTPSTLTAANWRDAVAGKRAAQLASIPPAWILPEGLVEDGAEDVRGVPRASGLMTGKELDITELDELPELCAKLASGEWSSVEVVTAYSKRAVIAHQVTNCLTEIFIDSALERAKELDAHLKTTGKPVGPLHGCPISLKDQFDIKGVELTMGYAAYLGRISQENCCLVDLLLSLGAVLYVRTNVPQTLMIADTENNVFGRTHNPINRRLSPGGSSGGEGALIAMKGSILGIGTDIGGSVRIPSAFCGLYTLRPSTRRVPYGKATNSMLGQESVASVAGPMARSMRSVTYFIQSVFNANPGLFDATALPFPFDQALHDTAYAHKKLSFGIERTDAVIAPTPPLARALEMAKKALEAAGHEVIEFDMEEFKRASFLAFEIFSADGGEDVNNVWKPIEEPPIPNLTIKPGGAPSISVYESWQLSREKEALQQAFLARWNATAKQTSTGRRIDALLSPAVPIVACLPGENEWPGYTLTFNVLDRPATVFPVTTVDPAVDVLSKAAVALNEEDQRYIDKYQPENIKGLPVCLQLVGERWRDEALLGVTARALEALKQA